MENLQNKAKHRLIDFINQLLFQIKEKKKEFKAAKAELKSAKGKDIEKVQKKVARLKDQVKKLKLQRTDRVFFATVKLFQAHNLTNTQDENKQIALGTSKLNYLDPRISVAWCKRNEVAIEKIFSKTQREKFRWAIGFHLRSICSKTSDFFRHGQRRLRFLIEEVFEQSDQIVTATSHIFILICITISSLSLP